MAQHFNLPDGISGFHESGHQEPPSLSLSTYESWLHTACRRLKMKVHDAFASHYPKNYHYIHIGTKDSETHTVVCNAHYPYLAFVEYAPEIFMPDKFRDLPHLAEEVRANAEITIFSAEALNARAEIEIYENVADRKLITDNLNNWNNSLGAILFNDWD